MNVALANIPKPTGSLSFGLVLEVEREARTCGVWVSRAHSVGINHTFIFS